MDEHGSPVPRDVRRLGVRPGGVDLRRLKQPLPCRQRVDRHAGGLGEAVEGRLIDIEDLRGLGYRKHHQTAVHLALIQKGRDERGQLLLAEIVPVVHQDAVVRQGQHRFGVGDEQVGQFRGARLSVGGGQHQLVDGVGVGHGGDLHIDPLFFSHRLVELIDEIVERGVCLAAVDVPNGNGGRRLLFFRWRGTARTAGH